jgi:hypothetical protein
MLFNNDNNIIKNIGLTLMGRYNDDNYNDIIISSLLNKQLCYTAALTLMSMDNINDNYDQLTNLLLGVYTDSDVNKYPHIAQDANHEYEKYHPDDPGAIYFILLLTNNIYFSRHSIKIIRQILDKYINNLTINQLKALNLINKVVQFETYFIDWDYDPGTRLVPVDYDDILIKVNIELKNRKIVI